MIIKETNISKISNLRNSKDLQRNKVSKNSVKESLIKAKDGSLVHANINKGTIENRNIKKITSLSKNEKIYEQGDGVIKIAPFDNYYMFTIYSELNLEDVPVDLHNMGSFFITFKDKNSEVRIENYTNTKNINPSNGQILFKITQENAEKILSLSNNVFYITSMIYDEVSKSDETVIYSGRFVEYNEGNITYLTDTIQNLNEEIDYLNEQHLEEINILNEKISTLTDTITNLKLEYDSLKESFDSYKESYEKLCKETKTEQKLRVKTTISDTKTIDDTLKKMNITKDAKMSKSKVSINTAVGALKQNIIGIKDTTKTSSVKKEKLASKTEKDVKLDLANIIVKKGVVIIYAMMYTKYSDLQTAEEKLEYSNLSNLYTSTQKYIKENKYNNIDYNIIYSETDYGKIISKYNVNKDSIIVTKNGKVLGKVNITKLSTPVSITKEIQEIINKNND